MLSAFKNFLITFLIGALLFGVIGYFATAYLSDIITRIIDGDMSQTSLVTPDSDEDQQLENNDGEDLQVPDGESFTWAMIGTDFRPDMHKNYYRTLDDYKSVIEKAKKEPAVDKNGNITSILGTDVQYIRATWIAVVRADKENREYLVCYISPETAVTAPFGETTLGEVYGLYGVKTLCEYLNAMTGLEIDNTFVLDGVSQTSLTDTLGQVNFDLPLDLYAGPKYHVSSPTTVIGGDDKNDDDTTGNDDTGDTSDTANSKEKGTSGNADKDTSKDTTKDTSKGTQKDGDKDEPVEIIENTPVMKKGKYALDSYSVPIINTFKEESQDDVDAKSSVIRQAIKLYLTRFSEWSVKDLTSKIATVTTSDKDYDISDPYSSKPTLATDFNSADVEYIHSMLGAIKYFDYVELTYPGTYSEKLGKFQPDIKSALTAFSKYRLNTNDTDGDAATDAQ